MKSRMVIYSHTERRIKIQEVKMQVLLKFIMKIPKLPVDYRRVFLSFFKKSLSSVADGKYYEKYYFNDNRRPFTFAVNLPSASFSKECITLGKNEVALTFSTGDNLAGFVFMSAFLAQKDKPFNTPLGNTLTLKKVSTLPERTVDSNSALVRMYSPLCLREHNREKNQDIYYSVANENFDIKSKEIIKEQLISDGFSENLANSVEIIPIDCKKTVVLHYNTYLECSLGNFVLNADKSVINHLLKSGIGSRKSAGFGFAQLVAEA